MAVCIQGVIGIAGGLFFGIFHRDDLRSAANGVPNATIGIRKLIPMLVRDAALRPVLIAGIAMVSFQYTFSTYVLIFFTSRLHIPIVTAGLIFALSQSIGIVGRISLAWISDSLWPTQRLRSLGWTMLICAATLLVFMSLHPQSPMWLLLIIAVVLGLFGIGWYPLYLVQVAEMAPPTALASTVSFAMTLNQISISLMPPLFGLVADLFGYQVAWASLVLMLIAAAVQLQLQRHRSTIS